MAKFCGRCGTRLDEAGLCPRCAPQNIGNYQMKYEDKQQVEPDNRQNRQTVQAKSVPKSRWERKTTAQKFFSIASRIVLWLLTVSLLVCISVGMLVYFGVADIPAVSNVLDKFLPSSEENGGEIPGIQEFPSETAATSAPETDPPETAAPTEDPAEVAYREAEQYCAEQAGSGSYQEVFRYLNEKIASGTSDERYGQLLSVYRAEKEAAVLQTADAYAMNGLYTQALNYLSEQMAEYDYDSFQTAFAEYRLCLATNRIAAGREHSAWINSDGTVTAVGANADKQLRVGSWENAAAVSVGDFHTVVLLEDATVRATGRNNFGQCNVTGWMNIQVISAGDYHTVALTKNGIIVATGRNTYGQCNIDALYSSSSEVVSVAAGYEHTVALREDGTVAAVGSNTYGQCNVSTWTDVVAVYAGTYHTLGLRIDGTVLAAGQNTEGQCNVTTWRNIGALSAGDYFSVGLKSDGTVISCGQSSRGQTNVNGWMDIVAIAAGNHHTLAMTADGKLVWTGKDTSGQCEVDSFY